MQVSNPSRGTCAFGRRGATKLTYDTDVSNPSRGTCAFGQFEVFEIRRAYGPSQTPLGERVPSACKTPSGEKRGASCLKPLSGNVCLRPYLGSTFRPSRAWSQTPLGERVPSALRAQRLGSISGIHVSNPSRGTCAFGRGSVRIASYAVASVSNPSRGTCAFGRKKSAR